jgi:hypothetical protein
MCEYDTDLAHNGLVGAVSFFLGQKVAAVLVSTIAVSLLLSAGTMVSAHANHQYRTEWEAHGAQSGDGGVHANILIEPNCLKLL